MRVAILPALMMLLLACGGQAPDAGGDDRGDGGNGAPTGAYAILTAGDETWTFYDDVYCDPLSPERYSYWLQGTEDPVNMIVSIEVGPGGAEAHSIGLYNHIERYYVLGMGFGSSRDFLRVDGKSVRGEVELYNASNEPVMATVEARCP